MSEDEEVKRVLVGAIVDARESSLGYLTEERLGPEFLSRRFHSQMSQTMSKDNAKVAIMGFKCATVCRMASEFNKNRENMDFFVENNLQHIKPGPMFVTDGFETGHIDLLHSKLLEQGAKYTEMEVYGSNKRFEEIIEEKLVHPVCYVDMSVIWAGSKNYQNRPTNIVICCSCGRIVHGLNACTCGHNFEGTSPKGFYIFKSLTDHTWAVAAYGLSFYGINGSLDFFALKSMMEARIRELVEIWRINSDKLINPSFSKQISSMGERGLPKPIGIPDPCVTVYLSYPISLKIQIMDDFLTTQMMADRDPIAIQGLLVSELEESRIKDFMSWMSYPIPHHQRQFYNSEDGCAVVCGHCNRLVSGTKECVNCWAVLYEGYTDSVMTWFDKHGHLMVAYSIRTSMVKEVQNIDTGSDYDTSAYDSDRDMSYQ